MTAQIIQFPTAKKEKPKNVLRKSPLAVVKIQNSNVFIVVETDTNEFKEYEFVDYVHSYFKDCVITFDKQWFRIHGENILIPIEAQI